MRLPVHIWIREENANPDELAGYFIELARHLDAQPQRMRLVIESTVPASLDFDPSDGDPVVSVGGRTKKFRIRHRWIPEHPVPLSLRPTSGGGKPRHPIRLLSGSHRTVLLIDPVDGNRFRVRSRHAIRVPLWCYVAFAVAAVAAAVTFHMAAIAAAALILSCIAGLKIAQCFSRSLLH